MRRLEYTRTIRAIPGRARTTAEAAMYLAHVARERHRLEQERHSLEKRIRRIEARLTTIAGAETKLTPALLPGPGRAAVGPVPRAPGLPAEIGEITLRY
jgi:hypothetical protein